jgi:hypothetical protein
LVHQSTSHPSNVDEKKDTSHSIIGAVQIIGNIKKITKSGPPVNGLLRFKESQESSAFYG